MRITLYGIPPSPPSHAVRLMVESKGVDHKLVWLLPGMHPLLVRTRGFRGSTVPAMKIDGRKLQNSREMSRALDDVLPAPPLFPADPQSRSEVEEAERWGEEILQNLPRRIIRWIAVHRPEGRLLIARDAGVPFPRFAAWINAPAARRLANKVEAKQRIQETIEQVPGALDHVDDLIARRVIGGDEPNAADFQIATNIRSLMTIADLRPAWEGRPAADLAARLIPAFGADFPAGMLPREWLTPVTG
jgi:glutathione S-transferase